MSRHHKVYRVNHCLCLLYASLTGTSQQFSLFWTELPPLHGQRACMPLIQKVKEAKDLATESTTQKIKW